MLRGERFNSLSHLVGALLAVAALVALVARAAATSDAWRVVSVAVFGATLVALYVASTAYHAAWGRAKKVLEKVDHVAIYFLIAGTYTPFALVTLRGPWGYGLFGASWGLAAIGVTQELLFAKGARWCSLALYLVMGWLVLVALGPLVRSLPPAGLIWLAVGGLAYTFGIAFFLIDTRMRHAHGIWHLFVLGGSTCHVISVLGYVL